jgi:hypothetical protein
MQQQLPLPPLVVLRAHVCILEWELAQRQARILDYERERLLDAAKVKYDEGLATCLAPFQAHLPTPLTCRIDVEGGCLLYDVPENEVPDNDAAPENEHVCNVLPRSEALLG